MALRFRSKFEADLAGGPLRGVAYEPVRILYYPAPKHYTPDFVLGNGIVVEAKGVFHPSDRSKTLKVIKDKPGIDLRIVFQTPYKTLSKDSLTTYAAWCDKNGIPWCAGKDLATLAEWKAEPLNRTSLDAIDWRPE